jgi:hypothetical protein
MVFAADGAWNATSHPTRIDVYLAGSGTVIPGRKFQFMNNGDFQAQGDVVAYNASDATLKRDIEPITNALEKVFSLDGVSFNWNDLAVGKDQQQREAGVIAQQVEQVLPEAVRRREDGNLGVAYQKLIPLLIEAVKELGQEVARLKKQ